MHLIAPLRSLFRTMSRRKREPDEFDTITRLPRRYDGPGRGQAPQEAAPALPAHEDLIGALDRDEVEIRRALLIILGQFGGNAAAEVAA